MSLERHLRGGAATALWLDALEFGRALFEPGRNAWFEASALLGVARPTRQALAPEVLVLPLLPWLRDRHALRHGAPPNGTRPARALRAVLDDAGLQHELTDALLALGSTGAMALRIDPAGDWLQWVGAEPGPVDEVDAEDVASYLAALLHRLPADAAGALLLHGVGLVDGHAEEACAPLCNAARHLGWSSVQCVAPDEPEIPGIDACAAAQRQPGRGWHAPDAVWHQVPDVLAGVPFICSKVPADVAAQQALAVVAALRG